MMTSGPKTPEVAVRKNAFVHKLYGMLSNPELARLIWWSGVPEGQTFSLYPSKEFANALHGYFKHGNVASFVRQLHMYGFHKVNDSQSSYSGNSSSPVWEFRHASGNFKKNDESSLVYIKRRSQSSAQRSSEEKPYSNSNSNYQSNYQNANTNYQKSSNYQASNYQTAQNYPYPSNNSVPAFSRPVYSLPPRQDVSSLVAVPMQHYVGYSYYQTPLPNSLPPLQFPPITTYHNGLPPQPYDPRQLRAPGSAPIPSTPVSNTTSSVNPVSNPVSNVVANSVSNPISANPIPNPIQGSNPVSGPMGQATAPVSAGSASSGPPRPVIARPASAGGPFPYTMRPITSPMEFDRKALSPAETPRSDTCSASPETEGPALTFRKPFDNHMDRPRNPSVLCDPLSKPIAMASYKARYSLKEPLGELKEEPKSEKEEKEEKKESEEATVEEEDKTEVKEEVKLEVKEEKFEKLDSTLERPTLNTRKSLLDKLRPSLVDLDHSVFRDRRGGSIGSHTSSIFSNKSSVSSISSARTHSFGSISLGFKSSPQAPPSPHVAPISPNLQTETRPGESDSPRLGHPPKATPRQIPKVEFLLESAEEPRKKPRIH